MIPYRLLTIIFILVQVQVIALTQCNTPFGRIELGSQKAVDDFLLNNPNCDTINSLRIVSIQNGDPIHDLSPLGSKKIVVSNLTLEKMPDLTSLHGLDSIELNSLFGASLNIFLTNVEDISSIINNTQITHLGFQFNDHFEDLNTFKDFQSLTSLALINRGSIEGIKFDQNKSLSLSIIDNESFDLNWLVENNSFNGLSITISNSKDFSLESLFNVDIRSINLFNNEKFTLKGLQNEDSLFHLRIIECQVDSLEKYFFENLVSIDLGGLEIINLDGLSSLTDLLPNIRTLQEYIVLEKNNNLKDIDVLNDLSLPIETPISSRFQYRIDISKNSLLDPCSSDYICRAKEYYPEELNLEKNLVDCESVGYCNGSTNRFNLSSRWFYEIGDYANSYANYREYHIIDTMHQKGKIALIIESNDQSRTMIMAQEGNRIYFWNDEINDFQLHYDFNEDEEYFSYTSNGSFGTIQNVSIKVDSIETRIINGNEFKIQHLRSNLGIQNFPFVHFEVVSGIGSLDMGLKLPIGINSPIEQINQFNFRENRLRCFEDESNSYSFVNYACDTIWRTTSTIEGLHQGMSFYPNPCSNFIVLNSNANLTGDLIVYDQNMKRVKQTTNLELSIDFNIDVSDLAPSVYFLVFLPNNSKSDLIYLGKLLKIH